MKRSPILVGTATEREMATRIGSVRICLGASAIFGAGLASRFFGLRTEHDNASARALGRLFGVRNIALGAWALSVRDDGVESRRLCYALNLAVDSGDVAVLLWPVLRRQGVARFALSSAILGSAAILAWIDLLDASAGVETPSVTLSV